MENRLLALMYVNDLDPNISNAVLQLMKSQHSRIQPSDNRC